MMSVSRVVTAAMFVASVVLGALPASSLDLERRRMLSAEESKPWRSVGRVNVASLNRRGMCTGTLIAPDLVITAAHCVVNEATGALHPLDDVHFVAGWRQGTAVAHGRAASIAVHPEYRSAAPLTPEKIGADLALIRLRQPIPEDTTSPFQAAPAPSPGTPLTLLSYRRDRAHGLTRQDDCAYQGAVESILVLDCSVTFGASGSPLFAMLDGEPRLIGVLSAKGGTTARPQAFAVRLDAEMPELLVALP